MDLYLFFNVLFFFCFANYILSRCLIYNEKSSMKKELLFRPICVFWLTLELETCFFPIAISKEFLATGTHSLTTKIITVVIILQILYVLFLARKHRLKCLIKDSGVDYSNFKKMNRESQITLLENTEMPDTSTVSVSGKYFVEEDADIELYKCILKRK